MTGLVDMGDEVGIICLDFIRFLTLSAIGSL